ncbi:gliding motility-associated C-terminal domain-containing protein [Flavobacterium sp.]|uniref:T9SS type B sorting domain-containing protein n=1 Tax=Flavobacterium sp. TaxID=239 RepID=UPI0037534B14
MSTILCFFCSSFGQNVSLYNQFNGRFDFTFIGNTMNLGENNLTPGCETLLLTSSSANLSLTSNQVVESAYLYWAGSGLGDFNVNLNTTTITAQRTFTNISVSSGLNYFSAFADITNQVITTGNGIYTLSNLDLSQTLINEPGYCNNRTNFSGWAILIVYRDNNLPLNQVTIYDGLQSIPNALNITLNSLNVIDNNNAQIGFIAWEGDNMLAVNETLKINGTTLSNPPLNPANNAFNGTNSFTGSSTLYNMDLDVYNIQNNISIGDTSAQIQLTSGQDVVLINTIVTKLNSQLPDASVALNNVIENCDSREITLDYNVSNLNCTNPLSAGTPIAIYANGQLVALTQTINSIAINGSENGQITVTIPATIPNDFEIKIVVDDDGTGHGIVVEIIETNNFFLQMISLWVKPSFTTLEPKISCNEGLTKGTFDFSDYHDLVKTNPLDTVSFYDTITDAQAENNPIINTTNYTTFTTPKEIFIRLENSHCSSITSFFLITKNCPPIIYNYVSANNDGLNDAFFIEGLRDIFVDFQLQIFNRWGRHIWTGNNQTQDWNGEVTNGFLLDYSISPKGTYYYILNLNDNNFPKPITGWLYFTK